MSFINNYSPCVSVSVGDIDEENFDPDAEDVDEYAVDAINGQSFKYQMFHFLTTRRGMFG